MTRYSTATAFVILFASITFLTRRASGDTIFDEPRDLASLVGTTFTIGNLAFTIDGVSPQGISPENVMLVPDAAPGNSGFALSGDFEVNSEVGEEVTLRLQLTLGLRVLLPDTSIVGISSTVDGVSAVYAGDYAFAQAQNSNWPGSPIATATEGYDSNGAYISSAAVSTTTDPFVSADFGLVQIWSLVRNGGSVSFDSVSFHFEEAQDVLPPPPPSSVPEPLTLPSIVAAVGAIACRRRAQGVQR